ncbi:glycerophosphodiester phosphodiesterase [Kribbella sp. NPDC051620]|uniref:glycerophosphodiester phosphodiesterase n=1 Tax=Kribbella sp. NPDC051620 TaxID=3364120 RepID=UPI0037A2B641
MTTPRTFVLAGHRGNMAAAPENTLLSFASAEAVGVDENELDVQLTRDGALVVLHDRTVERTAATSTPHLRTPIENLTLEQIRSVNLGQDQRIPTLDEVLDSTTALLRIEIKALAAAQPLADLLSRRSESDQARCIVTSFSSLSLADFVSASTGLPRGVGLHVPDTDSNWRDEVKRIGASTVLMPFRALTRALVDDIHHDGIRVEASLIEGPADIRTILELDVDASASNAPGYARDLLKASSEFTNRFPSFGQGRPIHANATC